MHRGSSTLFAGRKSRFFLLLAIPAAVLVVFTSICLFQAHRTLRRAAESSASPDNLAFTLQPLDLGAVQAAGVGVEPVASAPSFNHGVYFAGDFYLTGRAGVEVLAPDGTLRRTLRTGIELPVAPVAGIVSGRLRGGSAPELLLATAGAGLLVLQPNGAAAPTLRQLLPVDPEARDLTALLPLPTGDLLLGTRQRGALLYNGVTLSQLRFTLPEIDSARLQINALADVDAASFLIGTRNQGVFYAHAGTVERAALADGMPDGQVESLAVAGRRAFAGTPLGVAEFDLNQPGFRPARTLAPGVFAHAMSLREGQLDLGTLDEGIRQVPLENGPRLRPAAFLISHADEENQRVDAFLSGPDALYALADGGLLRRGSSGWEPALPPATPSLSDRNISALAFAPDGTLYVGFFDHGIDQLSPQGAIRHLEDDHLFCINRLVLDPVRQTIAAATADGLVLFDDKGSAKQTLSRRDGLISDHVSDIAFTPNGMALATPAGITFVEPEGTESLYAFQGLVNNHVYALAARPGSGQLLAGTLGGLSVLQGESVQRSFTVNNSGLKHNWITALLPTGNESYLVGTYGAGLATLDREGHFAPVELPAGTPRDLVINPNALFATATHTYAGTLGHGLLVYSAASGRWSALTQGLPSLNVTAFAARDGELYVGTENGLVRIAEARIP
jgi:ligand-binding sensor domain-containing protein